MQRGTVLKGALARMPQNSPRPAMDDGRIYAGGNPNFNEQTGRYNAPQQPVAAHYTSQIGQPPMQQSNVGQYVNPAGQPLTQGMAPMRPHYMDQTGQAPMQPMPQQVNGMAPAGHMRDPRLNVFSPEHQQPMNPGNPSNPGMAMPAGMPTQSNWNPNLNVFFHQPQGMAQNNMQPIPKAPGFGMQPIPKAPGFGWAGMDPRRPGVSLPDYMNTVQNAVPASQPRPFFFNR